MIGRIEYEIVNEWLFTPFFGEDGQHPVAPPDAVNKREELKITWQKDYPPTKHVEPKVHMFPEERDGRKIFVVRTELGIYRNP